MDYRMNKVKNIITKFLNWLRKSTILKIGLIVTGVSITSLILAIVIGFMVIREHGKNNLYNTNSSDNINFGQLTTDEDVEIEIDLDNMGESENESIESVTHESTTTPASGESVNNNETTKPSTPKPTPPSQEEYEPVETVTGNVIQGNDNDDYDIMYKGKKYIYNKDILTLLILGIDKDSKAVKAKDGISGGQSDGIYLVVMNPDTHKIDLITVHRDTIAKLWIYDKEGNFVQTGRAQICLQHGFGDGMELSNERAKNAISTLFYGLPIHSVTSVNMGAIPELNDAIGGVSIQALESFSRNGYTFEQGKTYTLKGMSAYAYVRFRDTTQHYTASKRLERQKQYLSEAMNQGITAIKDDPGIVVDIYNIIKDYVVTDLSVDEMLYLATEASGYTLGKIYTPTGTVDTSRKYERYYLDTAAFEELIVNIFYEEVK